MLLLLVMQQLLQRGSGCGVPSGPAPAAADLAVRKHRVPQPAVQCLAERRHTPDARDRGGAAAARRRAQPGLQTQPLFELLEAGEYLPVGNLGLAQLQRHGVG
eukprot:363952-Chlamydomonas_euryale.AAC.1